MSQSLPKVYQTIETKLAALAAQTELPEVKADLAIKSLALSSILGERDDDAARRKLDAAEKLVDNVDDEQERDYLRRILLEAAQNAIPNAAEEPALDALLDRIDDEDERQNALYSRYLTLAKALLSVDDYAAPRQFLGERVEELEDLRQYETVAAYLRAADRIRSIESDDPEIETPTGLIALYDGALVELLENANVPNAETLLQQSAADAIAVLDDLEKTLETGVDGEGDDADELEEDELDELAEEAAALVLTSPAILKYGEELRGYAERNDAFEMLLGEIALLLKTENADELNAALELAATLAQGNASRLVKLAATLLPAAPSKDVLSRAKNFVREALGVMGKEERSGRFVDEYAALVQAHLDANMPGPAGKLAALLLKELDAIDLRPTREFHKTRLFPLLLKACKREELEELIDSEDAREFQSVLEDRLAVFDAIKDAGDDPAARDSALAELFAEAFAEKDDLDPLVAADAILELAKCAAALL